MKIGSVSYSDVNSGSTADYKPIDEGTHSLSGTTSSGRNLTGTVSLTGKGTHKWTLKILPSGGAEIKED
ncbi:MAG: hypothetical protein KAT68_16530 [Bacteroidales bacterium]|nr:hypothetical protein [Bacteroidales bacterium]